MAAMTERTQTEPMHTAPDAMLADYAAGAVSPAVALLVASHIDRVDSSRSAVSRFEQVGGGLLADEAPADVAPDALDAVLAAIDAPESATRGHRLDPGPLPQALIDAVGTDFDRISWRFALPGVSEHQLQGFGPETVSLLRARPGASVPQHTHRGEEMTLILTGEMEDGGVIYGAGEIAFNDETDDHKPRIVGSEICHCLIVMTGPLRFTGPFSRALNYLAE